MSRLGQAAVAYVLALAGLLAGASIALRFGARAVERSITEGAW